MRYTSHSIAYFEIVNKTFSVAFVQRKKRETKTTSTVYILWVTLSQACFGQMSIRKEGIIIHSVTFIPPT